VQALIAITSAIVSLPTTTVALLNAIAADSGAW
jgi:hypothetical protein